ncbi:MAG: hypothetical protein H6576_10140 [Lewinellaceae bacterium]|nr:hypothetical protein [Saprospiraceae bacterium]MCB9344047.1 hypothetical protein [Lewinellaceae bacterium]
MTNKYYLFLLASFFLTQALAQTDADIPADRYKTDQEIKLNQEMVEVEYYTLQLSKLKEAFAAKDISKTVVLESAVLMALRNEINQLELKLAEESAQLQRRRTASSGQINGGDEPVQLTARDPFAEPVTPDEKRLETMQYTLAAFQKHSFDPAQPEQAKLDFEKLDKIQQIMEEALSELLSRQN